MTPGVVYDYVAAIAPSPPPPLKSSRSSGISRSCRSMFRCDGGTQPCTCYIIPSVLVAYMLFSILSTQRGACCIIPTMCFATLLMSNCTAPPTPEEVEVVEIVEVLEVYFVLVAVHSAVYVVLYLHCASPHY